MATTDNVEKNKKYLSPKEMVDDKSSNVPPEHYEVEVLGRTFYSLLIAVGVASTWRGGWIVLDAGLAPDNRLQSAWIGLLIGILMLFMIALLKRSIARIIIKFDTQFSMKIVDLIFSYFAIWCSILVWRGVWQLWDHILGDNPPDGSYDKGLEQRAWISHGAGVLVLLVLGGLRSASAPPTLTAADTIPLLGGFTNPPVTDFIRRFCSCESQAHAAERHRRTTQGVQGNGPDREASNEQSVDDTQPQQAVVVHP
eukprot:TRINITY_DN2411_c2_g1_i1.p1 TRINITY_DN2411_c2_g1~~TRINITY_DN2411_c2_g1_i1.p1  ORF type:complete len:282 (+),score=47.16 TRINITY_DN2411_c2_g1_i1:85-846(+)